VNIGITAIGIAGKVASSDNSSVSNVGKAVGGFFSFPAS
jgi:hypothetical protein